MNKAEQLKIWINEIGDIIWKEIQHKVISGEMDFSILEYYKRRFDEEFERFSEELQEEETPTYGNSALPEDEMIKKEFGGNK